MEITINVEIKVSVKIGVENLTNRVNEMELNKAVTKDQLEREGTL